MTRLRAAHTGDAGTVGAILSAFVDGTDWMPRVHSRAEDIAHADAMIARSWITVCDGTDGNIGFLARDGAEINALYVDPAHRNAGIGTRLLRDAQARACELTLWTFVANTGAQRFYLRHGFREIARGDGTANDEGLPDIRYHWTREAA